MDYAILFVFAFVVYGPTLRGSFVFDDLSSILGNLPDLTGSVPRKRFYWIWGARSLSRLTYAAELRIWNPAVMQHKTGAPDPFSFHVVNVIIHALNGCLVSWILGRLGLDSAFALIGGILFTVHPLATSAAAYIAARSSLISAFFGYLAIGLTLSGLSLLAIPCLLLAYLAKEDAVMMPFAVALAAWTAGSYFAGVFLVLPFVLAYSRRRELKSVRVHNGDAGMKRAGMEISLPARSNALTVIVEHILRYPQWMFGLGQNPDPLIKPVKWNDWRVYTACGIGLNVLALVIGIPSLRLPFAFIVLSPLSVYPFIPLPDPVFEHRAYFSILGIALFLSHSFSHLPIVLVVLGVALLASIATYRAMHWHNWADFWGWAIDSGSARKARCLQNLAAFYKLQGRYHEARIYLSLAVQVNPNSGASLCDLADIDAREGRIPEAKKWLEQAIERCPEFPQAWFGLGRIYEHLQEPAKAKVYFDKHHALARG